MHAEFLLMKKNMDNSLHWKQILRLMNSRQWFWRIVKPLKDGSVVLSFLPRKSINTAAPVIVSNDFQVRNFVGYVKKKASVQLFVTFTLVLLFRIINWTLILVKRSHVFQTMEMMWRRLSQEINSNTISLTLKFMLIMSTWPKKKLKATQRWIDFLWWMH